MIIAQTREDVNQRGVEAGEVVDGPRALWNWIQPIDKMSSMSEKAEPLILAIETATRAGSVAVTRGDELLSGREGDPSVSHSANLIEIIDAVLKEAGATLSDIDLFAVAVGPGSFTGLRIGLASVKAFAVSTGRKVVAVSTLAAIARATGISGKIVSLLPAGRGEVFAQLFSVTNGLVTPLDEPAHLTPEQLLLRYDPASQINWAGEGVEKVGDSVPSTLNREHPGQKCLAAAVAALALKEYGEGKAVAAEDLHAVYVRASDAEINERWQQQKAQSQTQS